MAKKSLTLTQRRIIDKLATLLVPEEIVGIAEIIRMLRKRLRMTQKQLADRSGVPQSYISKIESDELKPTPKTLKKLFDALYSDVMVVPVARESYDEIIEKQTRKFVKKNLEYVKGTMSLEEQLPNKNFLKELQEEEIKKLIYSETTIIWDV